MTAVHPVASPDVRMPARLSRIAVATDGSADADHALHTAVTLAKAVGASLEVVSVCELIAGTGDVTPSMFPPVELLEDPDTIRSRRTATVREQLKRLFGTPDAFHITVRLGPIASEIATFARENVSDLIVTGRGKHRLLDRVLGEEHLTRLLRTTSCPVLAVDPASRDVPRTVVIGLDLSDRDADVLDATAALVNAGAHIYLAHVKPETVLGVPFAASSWVDDYDEHLREAIANSLQRSALTSRPNIETKLLSGHPGIELTGLARRVNADLVVVGIHGAGFVHRMIVGSATTFLLRSVETSMLAVPPSAENV